MMRLFYLFIIVAHMCPAYGMNTENNLREHKDEAKDNNTDLPHNVTTQSQSIRRFSIGDYTDYLLHCLRVEEWRSQHPYKKYRKSDFHIYSERNRRKSLPPSFVVALSHSKKNQE